jgi:hypothetical protein
VWQATPTCPAAGGVNFIGKTSRPSGCSQAGPQRDLVRSIHAKATAAVASSRYAKDYAEVKAVGSVNSTARPQDRADVAQFYARPRLRLYSTRQQGSSPSPKANRCRERARPGPSQYGNQRQPRRVIRGEVLLPVLEDRDGDSRGGHWTATREPIRMSRFHRSSQRRAFRATRPTTRLAATARRRS